MIHWFQSYVNALIFNQFHCSNRSWFIHMTKLSIEDLLHMLCISQSLYKSIRMNDVSINNSFRSAQDNHWQSLIEKKSNFYRFCKWSIDIFIKYSNLETYHFKSKQSISISSTWIKRDLQNETEKLEVYVNNHLKANYKFKISESIHWISFHMKAKHSSWSRSTWTHLVIKEEKARQYCHDRNRCLLNFSQEEECQDLYIDH